MPVPTVRHRFIIAGLLIAAPASAQFPSDSVVRAIIHERVDTRRSPGIVVGLLEPGRGTRVFAYNDRAHGEPVFDGNTIFEIGSITKAFTGALLSDMVARGEVNLDDPVQKFLPATVRMPARGDKQITLLDLATQSSALPRLPTNLRPADVSNPYADYTVEQMYEFLSAYELTRDIGAQYEYSNLGVGLLGHVLALRSGRSYETLVRERILGPLKMHSTTITLSSDHRARLAPGHGARGDLVPNWDVPALAGAGALRSTVNDMLKFLAANLDSVGELSQRMRPALVAQRRAAGPTMDIGMGWHITKRPDRSLVWHNGGTGGYRAFSGLDPGNRRAVVLLTNGALSSDDIAFHLLDSTMRLMPPPVPSPAVVRREVGVAPDVLEKLVGEYELVPGFVLAITRADDKLFGQATGQGRFRLWAESDSTFFLKEVDAQIHFGKNSAGVVAQLTLIQDGQPVVGRKVR